MEGRIGAVFIIIQLSDGPIDILDFFHRAWNAELLRNAAAEPTGCLLRFPLLRVNDTICSGVVASVLASGVVRVVSSGSIEAAMAIADFVHAYVVRRLAPLPRRTGTKSIALLQVVLSPAPPLPKGASVDTSEGAAAWLRGRIASATAASGGGADGSRQARWWRCVRESSVTALRYRHTLRVVCHFLHPPSAQLGHVPGPAAGGGPDDRDADAFFFGSDLMSVVPLGSVFVAVGHHSEKSPEHDTSGGGGHKRLRRGSETRTPESLSLTSPAREDVAALMTAPPSHLTPSTAAQAAQTPLLPPAATAAAAAAGAREECPLVAKPQVKVEALLYRSGRVFATTDSVEALSFVVEEVLLPLLQRHGGD
ncbi:uncharacterized protein Tco025E_00991 [Trypanosoma conorhini]|uniref:Uncharacterized protein n=1 Tax=Trypanosoma conorhini TaxID=83891 RepID=A0A3R7N7L1_9TRYP|nr:uncharacterized protein Tco025E_00991 [Trypanosoma conorhini]RNF26757.1 hypothetical protein Tco025E_00991 [Trypanosoma conorhini]